MRRDPIGGIDALDGDYWRFPPPLDEFVESDRYLEMPPLTDHQRGVLVDAIGNDPMAVFAPDKEITEIVLLWGKGSGKDLVSSYVISWLGYIICCMSDANAYLGLPPEESIDIVNVAASRAQARNVFFEKLRARLRRECFANQGIKVLDSGATFSENTLRLFSLHSAQEFYEGMNVIAWVMDEASAFRDNRARSNAEGVYRTLRTSARSRFGERWLGFILSYPRYPRDFIMRRFVESVTNPRMYGDKAATWDVLAPLRSRADFQPDYDRDPLEAALVYECQAGAVAGAFFKDRTGLKDCARDPPPLVECVDTTTTRYVQRGDEVFARAFVSKEIAWLDRSDHALSRRYWIHGDPSLKGDFAVAIGHREQTEDGPNRVVIDALLKWEAKTDTQVDVLNVADVILELAQTYDVRPKVTFDQWNSAAAVQKLLEAGIDAQDLSFSNKMQRAMFLNLRSLIYNLLIEYPDDPVLIRELEELESDGRRVDHPPGGSKDVADCVATVAWYASGAEDEPGDDQPAIVDMGNAQFLSRGPVGSIEAPPLRIGLGRRRW